MLALVRRSLSWQEARKTGSTSTSGIAVDFFSMPHNGGSFHLFYAPPVRTELLGTTTTSSSSFPLTSPIGKHH